MSTLNEPEEQQEADVNKKLFYTPPVLTILEMQKVETKGIGVSETLCGCGTFS